MFGIDVSHNNGIIDWNKVKANSPKVDFAMLKASEGVSSADKKLLFNIQGCAAAGIPWGAYHFATWNLPNDPDKDARTEALFFISLVESAIAKTGSRPSMPLVLDIESNKPIPYTRDMMMTYIKSFITELVAAGFDFALYGSRGFMDSYLPRDHKLGTWKLWLAQYNNKPVPVLPIGWNKAWMWQYTDQGKCNGIITNVDLNKTL